TFVSSEKGVFMKLLKGLSVLVAMAGLGVVLLIAVTSISGHPLEALSQSASKAEREPAASVGVQSDRSEPRRRGRELTILSGRGRHHRRRSPARAPRRRVADVRTDAAIQL